MIYLLRKKKLTAALILLIGLMLTGLIGLCIYFHDTPYVSATPSMFLNGEYSIDGGKWTPIDAEEEINESFQKIVFRGVASEYTYYQPVITVYGKNIWYTLKDSRGNIIGSYRYEDPEVIKNEMLADDADSELKQEFYDNYLRGSALQFSMPNTPGYSCSEIVLTPIYDSSDSGAYSNPEKLFSEVYTLEVEYPYNIPKAQFSDCFEISIGSRESVYALFFVKVFPYIMLFSLVCFFGLFFFPIAGFIFGKMNFQYFSFGALLFFWGIFMIVESSKKYLNLWISDSTVCLLLDAMTNSFFVIAVLLYLRSNLEQNVNRAVAAVMAILYLALTIASVVLHFAGIKDVYASSPYLFILTSLCTIVMAVMLFIEVRYNKKAIYLLVSWIPLAVCIILDIFDDYLHFTNIRFFIIGIAITLVYQLVRLVLDLKKQYKESIRYQQMQKELYEAKVAVMVSQIQPHFLYNSLTSIAMMCTKDPKLAKTATINFADYLRGNMNSLKQTAPVPFSQELEHLKKYLMLEQMRFGDMLTIQYDIQTTDFSLPQLSVQPLVENAVKHGVGMKEDGGTVTIATRELPDCYEVIISDDGVGFDVSAPPKNDGKNHVGMENTRQRLKDMCNAEVIIESEIGKGAVSTIRIPKEEQSL